MSARKKLPVVPAIEIKHYDIKDAALRHSVAVWYVRSKIWDGSLPATMRGKKFLISAESLDKHFADAEMVV